MKKIFSTLIVVFALVVFTLVYISCQRKPKSTSDENVSRPLNISIYIDLSDRIERELSPTQKDRDIDIVTYIADKFKDTSMGGTLLQSTNRMQVFFYPTPPDTNIATLANSLNVDMGKTSMQDKKKKLQSMGNEFKNSLEQIYTTTLQTKNYIGSDIWGFFSNKTIDKYCIREGARNILVILTDGFVYDARNIQENVKGDSCSYITPKTLGTKHLWVTRQGLDSLEVLLLELNPYTPTQQTPLCEELTQWFEGMGVKKLIMACTDMPVNTQHIIDDFIK